MVCKKSKLEELWQAVSRELPEGDIDHWQSDLYVRLTHTSEKVIERFMPFGSDEYSLFKSGGSYWFEIPFGYIPYWSEKSGKERRGFRSPKHGMTPYERTRASVYATGNKWAIENFEATH